MISEKTCTGKRDCGKPAAGTEPGIWRKTGQGFVRFIETRMKTPESIAEKLQRKDYDVDFDTAVTALNDISGVRCICYSVKEIYWIARQIGKQTHIP